MCWPAPLVIGVEIPYGNTFMPQPGAQCLEPQPGQPACLPLAERFFAGGGNSHRGFGLNQAGPRDPNTGFPLGGTALFVNNIELRMPPPTLPFFQDNISFVIFHDAGNVFGNAHDLFHNLLRWSQKNPGLCMQPGTATQCDYSYISHAIGVGVRYKTPVGPVRFDFGYNLNPPAFPVCNDVLKPGQTCPLADFRSPACGPFQRVIQHRADFLMKRKLFTLIGAVVFLAATLPAGAGEVIDRVVATVNGHIILLSDWEDSLRYEAFSAGRPLDGVTAEDRKSALDHLIDQELLREQLQGFGYPAGFPGRSGAPCAGDPEAVPRSRN